MRTGRYSLAELFSNRHIEQLVIPEIQRDYVWGEPQVKHLLDSILRNFGAWRQEWAAPTPMNLTHLVNLDPGVPLQQLERIRDTFYNLLPPAENASGATRRKVAADLLLYGAYWNRVSPWYLENYNLGDWPRTIRGRGDQELARSDRPVFREFFDEFLQSHQSLDDFASEKRRCEQVDPKTETDLRKTLIWYSEKLGSRFLAKGMHVEIKSFEDEADAHFTTLRTIWNTQGDFKGYYGNAKMSDQMGGLA